MDASDPFIVRMTTSPPFTWFVKNVASRLDPLIFRVSGGRLTSMGPAAMPMLTLTSVGRHSGRPRSVHLACLEDGDDFLVVASAMGQSRHPAWRYNPRADRNCRKDGGCREGKGGGA